MKKLLVALMLLYPLSVMAETYEWTDQQGTVHFTEDLGKIPKKYRKKAKVLGGEESGAPEVSVTNDPAKGQGKSEAKGEEQDAKKLYGGKDQNSWRAAFRTARFDVKRNEAELASLKGRLNDTSTMSRSEYLSIQNTIKHTEVTLREAQQKLDELQASADRAGVPPEARQ